MMLASAALIWLGLWAALAISVLLAGLYSALETSVYVVNKIRLDLKAEAGYHPAQRLRKLLRNMNNVLAVLLTGSCVTEYAATFAVSTMFVLLGTGDLAEWYTMATATPAFFILAGSVPKNVAQRWGDKLAYRLSWFLWLSVVVFNAVGLAALVRGFSWLLLKLAPRRVVAGGLSPLSHEFLPTLVAEGQASGVLTHAQSIMADRIIHIAEKRLRDVMIPMAKVVKAPSKISRRELVELLQTHNHSRVPMTDTAGQIVGVLDLYDILLADGSQPPAARMTPTLLLGEDIRVTDALYQMQRNRRMLAVVNNKAGKHVGIVTIKDLVEEIVGDLDVW